MGRTVRLVLVPVMSEQEIRIDMAPKWKAVQARFIDMCGGDSEVMRQRLHIRDNWEAPLIEDYHRRVAALVTV